MAQPFFDPKGDHVKTQTIYFLYFFACNPKAKYYGVLPRTPQVRPKSEIYTFKRDDEHPHPLPMQRAPPPPPPPPVEKTPNNTHTMTIANQQ